MELRPYQSCRTNEGWIPVNVASSQQNLDYTVMVCPWGLPRESICECAGYNYRGNCRHQKIAFDSLCRWNELKGQEKQTDLQRETRTCPRCGNQTKWEIMIKEDNDYR